MDITDQALIARVMGGEDLAAFGSLVERHQSSVRGLLMRLTRGNPDLADDLAQETFMSAYRNIGRFRGDSRFSTWVYRIAYNAYLMYCRKAGRMQEQEFEDQHSEYGAGANDSLARNGALRIDLERALGELRAEERGAITLCFSMGMTHEEAAIVMDMPLGTLKSHIARGKAQLKNRLSAWQEAAA